MLLKALMVCLLVTSSYAVPLKEPIKKPLSLKDALKKAYEKNPDILSSREEVISGHNDSRINKAAFLPTISLESNYQVNSSINSGETKNQQTPNNFQRSADVGVVLNQNIYNGGMDEAKQKEIDIRIKRSWSELCEKEEKLFIDVITAYVTIYALNGKIIKLAADLKAKIEVLRYAQARFQAGESTQTDIWSAQADISDIEAQIISTQNDIDQQKFVFKQLTTVDIDQVEEVSTPKGVPTSFSVAQQALLEKNSTLEKAKFEYDMAKAGIQESLAGYHPTVDARVKANRQLISLADQKRGDSYNEGTLSRSTNTSFLINVTIPLSNGGKTLFGVQKQRDMAVSKRISIDATREALLKSLMDRWASLKSASEQRIYLQKIVEARKGEIMSLQQEVAAGTRVLLDVLTSQNRLRIAELALIDVQKNERLIQFQILLLIGRLNPEGLQLATKKFSPQSHYNSVKDKIIF